MLTFIKAAIERVRREPILLRNAAFGIAAILLVFGITVPDETINTALDVSFIVLGILGSWLSARNSTTPTADPVLKSGTVVTVEETGSKLTV